MTCCAYCCGREVPFRTTALIFVVVSFGTIELQLGSRLDGGKPLEVRDLQV